MVHAVTAQTKNKTQAIVRFLLSLFTVVLIGAPVLADQFDDQIATLKVHAAQAQALANQYGAQAADYQGRVNQLQSQISALQAQISLNQAQIQKLQQQIDANQQKLDTQKSILAASIKQLYFQDNTTPLEILFSSNSLSDFFNKQEYENKVNQQIQQTMQEINKIQKDLASQRDQANATLNLEKIQNNQLVANRREVDQLLAAASQGQDSANRLVQQSNSRISQLRAQQAALLAANSGDGGSFGGRGGACDNGHGNGGYPAGWCNAPQDAPGYGGVWGYNRECVSWAGYRRSVLDKSSPYGGNANQWDDNARAQGYRVDGSPEVGAIAQTDAGFFGHVAVVESISGGNVVVSEMNYDNAGHFRLGIYSASYFKYIH